MESGRILIMAPYMKVKYFDIYIHMQIKIIRNSAPSETIQVTQVDYS